MDTPGDLSGENQRAQRGYDLLGTISWFAARFDLILLLFDPYKLDFNYEFKRAITCLRGHDDKIRVILNKADQVNTEQVRCTSSLDIVLASCILLLVDNTLNLLPLWLCIVVDESLWVTNVVTHKSFETQEAVRVYIG